MGNLNWRIALVALTLVLLVRGAATTATELVTFSGRLEGAASERTSMPPFLFLRLECRGQAQQLGNFSLTMPHLVATQAIPLRAEGTFQFAAADGAMLFGTFTGEATPVASGVVAILEHATILGGTGRFTGARGEFDIERRYDSVRNLTFGSFTGVLTSVGSLVRPHDLPRADTLGETPPTQFRALRSADRTTRKKGGSKGGGSTVEPPPSDSGTGTLPPSDGPQETNPF